MEKHESGMLEEIVVAATVEQTETTEADEKVDAERVEIREKFDKLMEIKRAHEILHHYHGAPAGARR